MIWTAGYALAATSGYLRIAADRHYLTDVVVGAVVGSGIGLAVPLLVHPRIGDDLRVVPADGGIALAGEF